MSELLSINEAANYFKISRRTFSALINRHRIKYLQIGRQKRFELAELKRAFAKVSGTEVCQNAPVPKLKSRNDYAEFYELLN